MADFNLSFAASELNAAINKANAAAPQSTTYTKTETDALLANKPGEITTGKQYVIDGQTITAGTGAEAFNDLTGNKASGMCSHAEGNTTTASGPVSHAEGNGATASAPYSHAEGGGTKASGMSSHAEGNGTTASGMSGHSEGAVTTASGNSSHAECSGTTASGYSSHSEGGGTTASGVQSHADGNGTMASGDNSHAEGQNTKASSANQHVQGKYNTEDTNSKFAFIIGNGTADNARHNAFAIDWNGLIYVNGAATGVNVATLAADLAALTARVEALENQ